MKQPSPKNALPQAHQGAIVLVHGYLDGPKVWQRMLDQLYLPEWDVLVCHLNSSGEAKAATSEATLNSYMHQVLACIDNASPAPRRVVLVGHSMGGQVVELVARERQDLVAGLILLTPAPLGGTELPPDVMARFRSRIDLTDPVSIGQGKRALGISLDDDAVDVLIQSTLNTARETALEQLQAWTGGHPAGANLSAVQAPVLTIATDDRFFTVEVLEQNATRFQRSSLKKISGAGHWPQLEQPQALAQVLESFVRNLPLQC